MMPLAFIHHIGAPELIIVGFVSLLIFGNRLPSVMRSLGKSVTEFKKGVQGLEEDIDSATSAANAAAEEKAEPAKQTTE